MSSEVNKKNIDALAQAELQQRKEIKVLKEDMVDLKRLVTNLTSEVQGLRSELNIQKAMGGAIGSTVHAS